MSADRLFQMVYLLLEHGRLTAGQLAEKLDVSVRTVYRDVDALSAAGVPICTTQGQGGGVSLMDGFVLDRAAFTEEEQCQLLSALRALPAVGDGAALTKLSALFRQGGQEGWLQVHLSRWGDCHGDDALFNALRQAILGRREIAFRYASSQGLTLPRRALPARLVYKGQGWYLQALDLDREDYRTFRLTRILDLTVTDRQFHRQLAPPDIDFDGEIPPLFRLECVLRFSPALAWRVYDEFDRDCVTTLADGRLEVRAVFPEDQWLYGYLLSFGAGVEIVAPDDLRRRMALLGREIYQVHGEPDTPCQVCCGTMGPSKQKEVPTTVRGRHDHGGDDRLLHPPHGPGKHGYDGAAGPGADVSLLPPTQALAEMRSFPCCKISQTATPSPAVPGRATCCLHTCAIGRDRFQFHADFLI